MFDVSSDGANFWFDISNVILLVGAVLVAIGTYGTIRFAGIKEKFSDGRIAANGRETRRAIADSDTAKEGMAKANDRVAILTAQAEQLRKDTVEAQLELEKIKAPREISDGLRVEMISLLSEYAGTPFDLGVNPGAEPQALMMQIASILETANWKWERMPDIGSIAVQIPGKPSAKIMTNFIGLGLEFNHSKPEWTSAANTLCVELRKAVPETKCVVAQDPGVPPNAIHILIGTKM